MVYRQLCLPAAYPMLTRLLRAHKEFHCEHPVSTAVRAGDGSGAHAASLDRSVLAAQRHGSSAVRSVMA